MSFMFYPQDDEIESGTLEQKLEILGECAERYKAIVLDTSGKYNVQRMASAAAKKRLTPRDIGYAWNWEALAKTLREVRDLPEGVPSSRLNKSMKLQKLADVYEILRGARMPKLEAVRIALMNEAKQLQGG